eukprot:3827736-Amphidinium_carterae.1
MLAEWRRNLAHLGRPLQACRTASGLVSTAGLIWTRSGKAPGPLPSCIGSTASAVDDGVDRLGSFYDGYLHSVCRMRHWWIRKLANWHVLR